MLYIGYNNRKPLKVQVSTPTATITLNIICINEYEFIHHFHMNVHVHGKQKEKTRVGERESSELSSVNAVSNLFETVVVAASACQ